MSGEPREVHLRVPRDILRYLLEHDDKGVPFQTPELGFPLRIVLWGDKARKPKGFRVKRQPKKEEDL